MKSVSISISISIPLEAQEQLIRLAGELEEKAKAVNDNGDKLLLLTKAGVLYWVALQESMPPKKWKDIYNPL